MTSEPTITVELTEDRGVLDRLEQIERMVRLLTLKLDDQITYTVDEAAKKLSTGPKAVRGLVHTGKVRAIRLGTRKLLIPRSDLLAWVEREAV